MGFFFVDFTIHLTASKQTKNNNTEKNDDFNLVERRIGLPKWDITLIQISKIRCKKIVLGNGANLWNNPMYMHNNILP